MSLAEQITQRIQAAHPGAVVHLTDLTGGGDHWGARVVAESFSGQRSVQRQRSIYAALGELMRGPIHALTLKTLTPAEAEAE